MVLRRVLLFSSSMALALVVLSPVAANGASNAMQRPVMGIGEGSTTVNLDTGAGTGESHGVLLGIGFFTASGTSTYVFTGPNTFSSTATGTLVTGNGSELFVTSAQTGTLNGTASATSTTTDTITGGTGRFAGATGQLTIYGRSLSVSIVGSTETITTVGFWVGTISNPGR